MCTVKRRALGATWCVAAIGIHCLAWAQVAAGSEEWGTWFYQAAWWSYIAAVAGFLYAAGRAPVLHGWRLVMLPWSAVWWLIFDIYGLRLQNWYYVMAPPARILRWAGFWTAFATVIPLTLVTEDALRHTGLFSKVTWRGFAVTTGLRRTLTAAGFLCFLLPLAAPRFCYPLTWVFAPLLIEPWLAVRGAPSLLTELSEGRPGRLLRLLVTGFIIGILWELFNHGASSRWIYTVPGFETGKLFEMPLPGFLGFPAFAVGTYSFWAMVKARLGIASLEAARRGGHWRRNATLSVLVTILFCLPGFALIDWGTVRSFSPVVEDLPGWEPRMGAGGQRASAVCEERGHYAAPPELRDRWCRLLTMAAHRGMGLDRALQLETLGITAPGDLAGRDSQALLTQWPGSEPPRREEVTVWITAAPQGDES